MIGFSPQYKNSCFFFTTLLMVYSSPFFGQIYGLLFLALSRIKLPSLPLSPKQKVLLWDSSLQILIGNIGVVSSQKVTKPDGFSGSQYSQI